MQERKKWIDIAKGIGILLVVIGHCPRDIMRENSIVINLIYQIIYSFHMPLFFFISGYNFKSYDSFVKTKKIEKQIIPFFVYSILIYFMVYIACLIPMLYAILAKSDQAIMPFFDYMVMVMKGENPYSFHLWFIYGIFLVEVIAYIINKIILNFKLGNEIYILVLFFSFLGYFVVKSDVTIISLVISNLPFYFLGIVIKKDIFTKKLQNKKILVMGPLIIIVQELMVILKLYGENKILTKITNGVEYVIGVSLTILLIVFICKKVENNKFLEYLGKNSYNIYLLHQPYFCGMLGMVLIKLFPEEKNYLLIMFICMVSSIFIPIAFVKIIGKFRVRSLFEKTLNIKEIQ